MQNAILPSDSVRDLGVLITSNFDWGVHINNMCMTANRICAWILNVFKTRNKITLLTLFNSMVRSKLEYCCQLWDPVKLKLINCKDVLYFQG